MIGIKNERESSFQSRAVKYIESRGGYAIPLHISSHNRKGEPDIICCYRGIFVAFELKEDYNKPSKIQEFKLSKLRQAGGIAKAVYTMNEIKETLDEIFRVQQGDKS